MSMAFHTAAIHESATILLGSFEPFVRRLPATHCIFCAYPSLDFNEQFPNNLQRSQVTIFSTTSYDLYTFSPALKHTSNSNLLTDCGIFLQTLLTVGNPSNQCH
eukprot:Gb_00142 [translate_table: standard]